MNALGRFSIRTRLYFGTVFSLILLVVIGAMGYVALDRTRGTLQVLFSERVQTLTDMSELRTTLGDLRRTEKDIIINFNNSVEVSALRESWAKTLASLRKSLAEVRQVQSDDSQRAGVELGNRGGVQMNQSRNSGSATQQALVLNGRPVRLGLQTTTPIRLLQGFVRNGRVVTTVGTV
eukprot:gene18956-38112_t